ncbi:serine hydrolase [Spiractinospora alimapuensis]|uniref:serine hydrolase n=1 Tax=Spiractinospora alimapuensis TaxID=2820884 RepID=UPI001F3A51A2|nr:serine hydrolase [Spiractinospora alimapuensis]QVQ54529.1 serine hydrolase [Spiractinospora alimapuensis]
MFVTTPDENPPRRFRRGARAAFAVLGAASILAVSGCGAPAEPLTPTPPIPTPPSGTGELTEEDVNAWLDGLIPPSLEQTRTAGATVAVVHNGELLTARGYGYADNGSGESEAQLVDPEDTVFRVGSVSKLFTATAVMQLVESGDIDLDTDIDEYLDFEVERTFDQDLTMRHLLTHTPGYEERLGDTMKSDGEEVDLRDHLVTDPPAQVYEPGTVPAYSNYGNALAGYIVEVTSGMPFDEYVQENVLEPIGMNSSTFTQPLPDELDSRLAAGYGADGEPAGEFEVVSGYPAGSLSASATDMALFMQAHLGTLQTGQPMLEPETLELMQQPAADEEGLGNLANGPQMTLGFFDESRNGHRIIGHGGDTNLFHSEMQIYPETGSGIFVSVNSGGNTDIASVALREEVALGFADRYFPPESGALDADVEPTAQEHAAIAEGRYESSRGMYSTFLNVAGLLDQTTIMAQDDGTIIVEPNPTTGRPAQYEEIEPWVWREVGGQRILSMRVENDEVQAIGFASAFSLLPSADARDSGIALPILIFSVTVFLISILSWPIGAIVRRRLSWPTRGRAGRIPRILTRVSVSSALAAFIGWTVAVLIVMSIQEVPHIALRGVQVLQVIGFFGAIPAAVVLFNDFRHGAGWWRRLGSALVFLALVGSAWFSAVFSLVATSVTY